MGLRKRDGPQDRPNRVVGSRWGQELADIAHTWPLMVSLPICLILHECAHARMAVASGDGLPARQGRTSLAPAAHLDPIWSIAVPLVCFIVSGGTFIFGLARPVQVRPERFRKPRVGLLLTASAGPLANLITGSAAALTWRLLGLTGAVGLAVLSFALVSMTMFSINLLVPLPPLDGSRVVAALLPTRVAQAYLRHGTWGFVGLLLVGAVCMLLLHVDPLELFLSKVVLGPLRVLTGV